MTESKQPDPVPPAPPAPPAPTPPKPVVDDTLRAEVAAMRAENRLRNIRDEFGASTKQAESIAALMDKHGLGAGEALILAKNASPELWKQPNPADFPASHGASRPGIAMPAGDPPPRDEEAERHKFLMTADANTAKKHFNNELGHWAAQEVGIGHAHRRLPIPQG